MKVKLLLKEEIIGLGVTGDVVEVAPGYARNYLIPNQMAFEVNESTRQAIDKARREWIANEAGRKDAMVELAERLQALSLTIAVRVSETGSLYGSVGVLQILEALAAEGIQLESRAVRLRAAIKEVGDYNVPIRLHSEVSTELKVTVEALVASDAGEVDTLHGDDTDDYGDGRDEEFDPPQRRRRRK